MLQRAGARMLFVQKAARSQPRTWTVSAARRARQAPPPVRLLPMTAAASRRLYSSSGKSTADSLIEEIQEQYATAKDEFEIAVEETEKNTVYAPDDRAAAAEEMAKLQDMYRAALHEQPEEVAADIKRRIGQRVRELDEAIKGLEESARQGD